MVLPEFWIRQPHCQFLAGQALWAERVTLPPLDMLSARAKFQETINASAAELALFFRIICSKLGIAMALRMAIIEMVIIISIMENPACFEDVFISIFGLFLYYLYFLLA